MLSILSNKDLAKGRDLIKNQKQRDELNKPRNVTPICKSLIGVKCASKNLHYLNITKNNVWQDLEEQSN